MNDRKKIDGMKVIFTEDDVQQITENVAAVLRSGHLIKGLFLDDFANRVAKRCSKTNAAMCSSDTSAMEMLFVALDVNGKIVVFQGNMFPSPIFACMRAGGIPMYADMELTGLGMAADSLLKVIDGAAPARVGAVVVMHTAGIISPKFPEIVQVCDEREIPLIEDCAHAYGSTADGIGAGSWGDYAAFSFYATKPMCTGEGGAICSDNAVAIEAIDMLARYGKTEIFGAPFCEFAGYSNRMTELLAAVGVVTDSSLEKKLEKRRKIAQVYDNMLKVEGMVYGEPGQNYYKYVLLPVPDHPTPPRGSGETTSIYCHQTPLLNKFSPPLGHTPSIDQSRSSDVSLS